MLRRLLCCWQQLLVVGVLLMPLLRSLRLLLMSCAITSPLWPQLGLLWLSCVLDLLQLFSCVQLVKLHVTLLQRWHRCLLVLLPLLLLLWLLRLLQLSHICVLWRLLSIFQHGLWLLLSSSAWLPWRGWLHGLLPLLSSPGRGMGGC